MKRATEQLGAGLLGDLGHERAHGDVGVLHEGLLQQRDLLEELVQAAFGDLRLDGLGLAGLGGLRHVDALLVLDDVGRHVLARDPAGGRGGDVHGDVAGERGDTGRGLVRAGDLHEHADAADAVDVAADDGGPDELVALEARDAHVLAELGDHLAERLLDGQRGLRLHCWAMSGGVALGDAVGVVDGDLLGTARSRTS